MARMFFWFFFGIVLTLSIIMVVFGILFIRDFYLHDAEIACGSLVFGIALLLAGGGLASSTIAETVRRLQKH